MRSQEAGVPRVRVLALSQSPSCIDREARCISWSWESFQKSGSASLVSKLTSVTSHIKSSVLSNREKQQVKVQMWSDAVGRLSRELHLSAKFGGVNAACDVRTLWIIAQLKKVDRGMLWKSKQKNVGTKAFRVMQATESNGTSSHSLTYVVTTAHCSEIHSHCTT